MPEYLPSNEIGSIKNPRVTSNNMNLFRKGKNLFSKKSELMNTADENRVNIKNLTER